MEFIIFNKAGSKVTDKNEPKLIWSLVFLAKKIHYGGNLSMFMHARYIVKEWPLNFRGRIYSNVFPLWDKSNDKEAIKSLYDNFEKAKSHKHKGRDAIILYQKGKSMTESFDKYFIVCCDNILKQYDLHELNPIVSDDSEKLIVLWLIHEFGREASEPGHFVKTYLTSIIEPDHSHVFDDSIENNFKHRNINEQIDEDFFADGGVKFMSVPFIKLPYLQKLRTSHAQQILSDVEPKIKPLMKELDDIKRELASIEFNFPSLEMIRTKTAPKFSELEKNILGVFRNNIYFKQLNEVKDNSDENPYCMHIGITSFGNLADIYAQLGIIEPQTALYIKEEITKNNIKPENTNFFFYVK